MDDSSRHLHRISYRSAKSMIITPFSSLVCTRNAFFVSRTALRAFYAISGTDMPLPTAVSVVTLRSFSCQVSPHAYVSSMNLACIALRACYAMPGADIAYHPTGHRRVWEEVSGTIPCLASSLSCTTVLAYATFRTTQCVVLTWRKMLRVALCSTDLAEDTRRSNMQY
eukprot:3007566-Rhodomonas_salina.3